MTANEDKVKTYVVFHDDYMGSGYNCYHMVCTYRSLLLHLNGLDDTPDDELVPFGATPFDTEEGDPRYYKQAKDLTIEDLTKVFNLANGDGGPYYVVYSVSDQRKVLG